MAGDRPHHQICCHDSLKDREMTLGQGLDLGPPPVLTHLNNHHLFWRNTEIWDNTKPGKHYIIFISVLSRGERGETRETAWCQYWQISVPGRGGREEGRGRVISILISMISINLIVISGWSHIMGFLSQLSQTDWLVVSVSWSTSPSPEVILEQHDRSSLDKTTRFSRNRNIKYC